MSICSPQEIVELENIANVMMAPPTQVTAEQRKEAETFFLGLRDGPISVDACQQVMVSTKNFFLTYQITQVLVARLLKDWSKFNEEQVENVCLFLLTNSPAIQPGVPNFVITEIFRSAAMVLKRASINMEILESDRLSSIIERFITNEDERMQSLGLQIIEAIVTEFSTAWRSSNISITWDFHLLAKKCFEEILLKKFMRLALTTLSQLLQADLSSPMYLNICEKFLRVASMVLSWNFQNKLFIFNLKILIPALKTNSFRPPASWADFFKDASIVSFFLQLHVKVRDNEQLAQHSLSCLIQLASLIGDVLTDNPSPTNDPMLENPLFRAKNLANTFIISMGGPSNNGTHVHDNYVQTFANLLMEVFAGGVLEHEMPSLTLIIYKLFTYHPLAVFKRFPEELFTRFVQFVVDNTLKLTGPAMRLALTANDQIYREPLHNLLQVWRTILRSADIFNQNITNLITISTPKILEAFMRTVLSPPFGDRVLQNDGQNGEITDENEEEEDDRTAFSDILNDIGFLGMKSLDFYVGYIASAFNTRIKQLNSITRETSPEDVRVLQEDIHWLLLLAGFFLQQQTFDTIGNLPEEVAMRCLNGYKSGEFKPVDFEQLVGSCLDAPFDMEQFPERLDPITSLSAQIFSWFALEHRMLLSLGNDAMLLSPELTRSSLWAFILLMVGLTPAPGDWVSELEPNKSKSSEVDTKLLPKIQPQVLADPNQGVLAKQIIDLALDKVFAILTKMPGEKKVCNDAINLIISFAEYRTESLAENEHLYQLLSGVHLENLPSRRPLIKSLVVIGSTVNSDEVRQKMYISIFDPLAAKFSTLCEQTDTDSALADLFECFSGVADAGQSEAALILFQFLQPIILSCAPLMVQRPDSQLLINSILEFMKTVTDVLFFYVESSEDCAAFHGHLLAVIDAYRNTQLQKYHSTKFLRSDAEEQQTQDLISLIEMLCHSISKTYMPHFDGAGSVQNSAKVALMGLEMILPLMHGELLKIPDLCASFFRLLLFISDLDANFLAQVSEQTMLDFLRCVGLALDNEFGMERLKGGLEIVNNLATAFYLSAAVPIAGTTASPISAFTVQNLVSLVNKVFAVALQYSCEVEAFNEAAGALYSLISLNKDYFSSYVNGLLELPSNQPSRENLQDAFRKLLSDLRPEVTRMAKRGFQEKLQNFLVEVSGVLCLS